MIGSGSSLIRSDSKKNHLIESEYLIIWYDESIIDRKMWIWSYHIRKVIWSDKFDLSQFQFDEMFSLDVMRSNEIRTFLRSDLIQRIFPTDGRFKKNRFFFDFLKFDLIWSIFLYRRNRLFCRLLWLDFFIVIEFRFFNFSFFFRTPKFDQIVRKMRRSIAWKFFRKFNSTEAKCQLCNQTFKYCDNTTNLAFESLS